MSCYTAEGWGGGNSLANMVIRMGRGRTVYASSIGLQFDYLRIRSYYPFEVRMIFPIGNFDFTYTNK